MPRPAHYHLELQTQGKTYKSNAPTIEEAFVNLGLSWENIKMKGVMTVKQGTKSHEHLFGIVPLRRILSNKIVREKWAQNLAYLMKEGIKTNIPKG